MDLSTIGAELSVAFHDLLGQFSLAVGLKALVVVAVVALFLYATRLVILGVGGKRISQQTRLGIGKVFSYGGFVLLCLVFFDSLGMNLSAILGAAGIVGVAVGFAAQSSVANIISGLFLLGEKPFVVGDVVNTGTVTGIVHSIDILSVKVKTFDNTLVRIPHELLIKSTLVNVTRFPIRRLDFTVAVSYHEDLNRVLAVLRRVIAANRFALASPAPFLMVQQLAASAIDVAVGIWFEKADLLVLKNSVIAEILAAFRDEGIEIPFPQVKVSASTIGAKTK